MRGKIYDEADGNMQIEKKLNKKYSKWGSRV